MLLYSPVPCRKNATKTELPPQGILSRRIIFIAVPGLHVLARLLWRRPSHAEVDKEGSHAAPPM